MIIGSMTSSQLTAIAQAIGTPCYVYDRARLERNYQRLAQAFKGGIHYAVKANNNLEILKILLGMGAGFDVVSVGEMNAALRAGAAPSSIVFAGVGKRDDELIAALEAGIGWINVESAEELGVLSELAQARGRMAQVALRINPGVDPHTHRYLATGKHGSKFGVDGEEALDLIANRANFPGVSIAGLHVHIGSMISEVEPYADALMVMGNLVTQARALGANITALDMGGGFGIAYDETQTAAPLGPIAQSMMARAKELGVALHIEPGRSIVGDAGVLLARVLYTKTNGDTPYVIVDAAMNDLIRPALYGAKHRVTPVGDVAGKAAPVNVVGPVCESGDVLATSALLPPIKRGDLLQIHDVGAYGMSMASNYNLRPRAAEVLIEGDTWRVIRPRENVDDLVTG
ncbi:MAG TPA: diaminopimelate decarboxylase [Thermoflexales bacterium]|nr:diaminopimelate decarboxylase [Thermoflexales bacterium]